MAIRKDNSATWVKVVIIFVAASFVIGLIPLVTGGYGSTNTQSTTTTQTGADKIASQYSPAVNAALAVVRSQPTSYTAQVTLGNAYYDWALAALQAKSGGDQPIWTAAVGSYKQALAIKSGDPSVSTDMAIAQFYSGDTQGAIATIVPVMKKNPSFANAFSNAAIFYQTAGDNAKAAAALQEFIAKNPKATEVSAMQQQLKQLTSATTTGSTTTTP